MEEVSILPGQLGERRQQPPELILWRTVLIQAAQDLSHSDPKIRAAAAGWFTRPDDADVTVNLNMVCEVLSLRPQAIARTALRWAGLA